MIVSKYVQILFILFFTSFPFCFIFSNESEIIKQKTFSKMYKAKNIDRRIEAIRLLSNSKDRKSIVLLLRTLKDRNVEIKKEAISTLSGCKDYFGISVAPLCRLIENKKENVEVRKACLEALYRSMYKEKVIDSLINVISGISKKDKELHKFGYECTMKLNVLGGQNYGAGEKTPKKWKSWWKRNQKRYKKEDAQILKLVGSKVKSKS